MASKFVKLGLRKVLYDNAQVDPETSEGVQGIRVEEQIYVETTPTSDYHVLRLGDLSTYLTKKVEVVSIANPSVELNLLAGSSRGSLLTVTQTSDVTGLGTVYMWDEDSTATENSPYIIDGSTGSWIAIGGTYTALATSLGETLAVTGALRGMSTLQIWDGVIGSGIFAVDGTSIDVSGDLTVYQVDAATGNLAVQNDAEIGGAATVGGTLGVTGATTLTGALVLEATSSVTGDLIPTTDEEYDLGTSQKGWDTLYTKTAINGLASSVLTGFYEIRIPVSATGTPGAGTMYVNTSENKLYVYNGTAWKSIQLV